MKTFILIFLTFLIASTSFAAAVTNKGSGCARTDIELNGKCIDLGDVNIKKLAFGFNAAVYDTGVSIVDSSMTHYTPAGGKKGVVLGIKYRADAGANTIFALYGDNPVDEGAIPTNPVYCGDSSSGVFLVPVVAGNFELGTKGTAVCSLVIPAGKYFTILLFAVGDLTAEAYIGECPDTGFCKFDNF